MRRRFVVQKRYESKNIPIEILRSFVTVVDTGSYTKAGELLNLSQAAVSAQIARLRRILHGELFTRGAERQLTSRGAIVLSYARRIIAMNDQLIATAGPRPAPRQLLVGLPRWYDYQRLVELIRACSEADVSEKVTFRCGDVAEFTRDLNTGSVDIAYMVNPAEQPGRPVFEWQEPMHWTKSPKLGLAPGEPVPLVGWPGTLSERLATKLLADAQMSYNIVFTGADHASRKAAVAAGLGLMLMMRRAMTAELVIADEPFLPPAPIVKTGIYAREGLNLRRIMPLVQILEGLLRPPPAREVPTAPAEDADGDKPARKRRV
jgi:DNA-binding transcriptional LysR family regulator